MIKARVVKQDGLILVEAIGHSKTDVCCAASMLLQAAALGLRDLAMQFPQEIVFHGIQEGGITDDIESTDQRPRKPSRRRR